MQTEEPDHEQQELFEHHRFTVDVGQALLRIDKFLFTKIAHVSRSKIQAAADAGCILVNEKPVKSSYKVKPGDVISVVMGTPPVEFELIEEEIPLNIVYEDPDLLIIDKKPGMVVHPAYGNFTGTMLNGLLFHTRHHPKLKEIQPYLLHRIDKDTSGILVVALNEAAQAKLAKHFYEHTIRRRYKALVWGDFDEDEGTITGHIGRSLKNRKVMDVFTDGRYGKEAITHYKVIERFRYVTLLECILETGRTHQIRAHMQHIGHPLFNDSTYGGDRILKGTTFTKYKQFIQNCFIAIPRQALHAEYLGFEHPGTGKFIEFTSPLPSDFVAVLDKWKTYVSFSKDFVDNDI
jgi:23S rRNA pseudouridine1911/1915/1917 synthase